MYIRNILNIRNIEFCDPIPNIFRMFYRRLTAAMLKAKRHSDGPMNV